MESPATPPPPPAYPTPPPPPNYPPYASWQPPATSGAPPPYRGPALPPWLSFGGILILVGGIIVLVGFLVSAFGTAIYDSAQTASGFSTYLGYSEASDVLVGIGIFLAAIGWIFHQMSAYRHAGR